MLMNKLILFIFSKLNFSFCLWVSFFKTFQKIPEWDLRLSDLPNRPAPYLYIYFILTFSDMLYLLDCLFNFSLKYSFISLNWCHVIYLSIYLCKWNNKHNFSVKMRINQNITKTLNRLTCHVMKVSQTGRTRNPSFLYHLDKYQI